MKQETKDKLKKVAKIAGIAVLGAFAVFGAISSCAVIKSCSQGENNSSIVTTTPVTTRVRKAYQPYVSGGFVENDYQYGIFNPLEGDLPIASLLGMPVVWNGASWEPQYPVQLLSNSEETYFSFFTAFNGSEGLEDCYLNFCPDNLDFNLYSNYNDANFGQFLEIVEDDENGHYHLEIPDYGVGFVYYLQTDQPLGGMSRYFYGINVSTYDDHPDNTSNFMDIISACSPNGDAYNSALYTLAYNPTPSRMTKELKVYQSGYGRCAKDFYFYSFDGFDLSNRINLYIKPKDGYKIDNVLFLYGADSLGFSSMDANGRFWPIRYEETHASLGRYPAVL